MLLIAKNKQWNYVPQLNLKNEQTANVKKKGMLSSRKLLDTINYISNDNRCRPFLHYIVYSHDAKWAWTSLLSCSLFQAFRSFSHSQWVSQDTIIITLITTAWIVQSNSVQTITDITNLCLKRRIYCWTFGPKCHVYK